MITYKKESNSVRDNWNVYIDTSYVGKIVSVRGGYMYRPKGGYMSHHGEIFQTLELCKQSLEG